MGTRVVAAPKCLGRRGSGVQIAPPRPLESISCAHRTAGRKLTGVKRPATKKTISSVELRYHVPGYVGQAKIAALKPEGELQVVQSQKVQYGRLKIVDMDLIFHGSEAQFIGGADRSAGFYASTGHPHREGVDVVVSAHSLLLFPHRGAAEF